MFIESQPSIEPVNDVQQQPRVLFCRALMHAHRALVRTGYLRVEHHCFAEEHHFSFPVLKHAEGRPRKIKYFRLEEDAVR